MTKKREEGSERREGGERPYSLYGTRWVLTKEMTLSVLRCGSLSFPFPRLSSRGSSGLVALLLPCSAKEIISDVYPERKRRLDRNTEETS